MAIVTRLSQASAGSLRRPHRMLAWCTSAKGAGELRLARGGVRKSVLSLLLCWRVDGCDAESRGCHCMHRATNAPPPTSLHFDGRGGWGVGAGVEAAAQNLVQLTLAAVGQRRAAPRALLAKHPDQGPRVGKKLNPDLTAQRTKTTNKQTTTTVAFSPQL
jgi:hypothetical protein